MTTVYIRRKEVMTIKIRLNEGPETKEKEVKLIQIKSPIMNKNIMTQLHRPKLRTGT